MNVARATHDSNRPRSHHLLPTARRRHICVATETYPPEINGVALTLARLVDGLRARGHLVSVVRPEPRASCHDRREGDPAMTVVRGLPLPSYGELCAGLPAGRVLRALWTARRPDVVYVATEGPLGWSAVRTSQRLGIPVFSGFHTNFHIYARHYHAAWLQPLIVRYLRRFHNATLGTLVATPELCDQLRALGVRTLEVLGRGVDGRLFSPERRSPALRATWGASDDDLVVLHVGRVAPEKNLPLAIEAFRVMQRAHRPPCFVVVGDGPLRPALQATHPDLRFCGVQTGEALAIHYASADVFLFPSETETFGNVVLEAMASGLAVVAYDYAGARLHLRHGETGVLVPYRDARAFVQRAASLAQSPLALRAMRRHAREYAARVDWRNVVERFEQFLTKPLEEAAYRGAAHAGAPESTGERDR